MDFIKVLLNITIVSLFVLSSQSKAAQNESLKYSCTYKCTLPCKKSDFEMTVLKKRFQLFGDIEFSKIQNGTCNTQITVRLRTKPDDKRLQEIEGFLSSHGKFGIHLLAKPEEVISVIDKINTAVKHANVSIGITDIRDFLKAFGDQIGVEERYIGRVESIINSPEVINALNSDTVEYRLWWGYTLVQCGSNSGNSDKSEKSGKAKELYFIKKKSLFNNTHIMSVTMTNDESGNQYLTVGLNENGKKLLSDLTGNHCNEYCVITMDSTVLNSVRIYQQCTNGVLAVIGLDASAYQYFGQMMKFDELQCPLLLCK